MVRSGKWPLRTTWRRPAASRQSWWRSIQSATSASMAWASSCWAPWRRRSVRTSWAWGSGTIRVSVVASIMVAYSCAALARWWTFDTPEYAAFSHPAIHNIRSYPPSEWHPAYRCPSKRYRVSRFYIDGHSFGEGVVRVLESSEDHQDGVPLEG